MRPTRNEHGTYVATPHRTARGFAENAAWHHHTTRKNTPRTEEYGGPEIIAGLFTMPLMATVFFVGWLGCFLNLPIFGIPIMLFSGFCLLCGGLTAIGVVLTPIAHLFFLGTEHHHRQRMRHIAYDNGKEVYVAPKQRR